MIGHFRVTVMDLLMTREVKPSRGALEPWCPRYSTWEAFSRVLGILRRLLAPD